MMGAMTGDSAVRSAGLMSKMSDALSGLRCLRSCVIVARSVCWSWNCGCWCGCVGGGSIERSGSGNLAMGGDFSVVLNAMVMKWSLREFAMEVGFVWI